MLVRFFCLSTLLYSLAGCALTTEQVDFDYQAQTAIPNKAPIGTASILAIQPTTDARNAPTKLIAHKTIFHRIHTPGGYEAPEAISHYVDEALQQRLSSAGYRIAAKAPVWLSSKILNLQCQVDNPLFGKTTTDCNIQVAFSLHNTHQQLWNDTLIGKGHTQAESDAMSVALNGALNQLADNLASHQSFQLTLLQQINNMNSIK